VGKKRFEREKVMFPGRRQITYNANVSKIIVTHVKVVTSTTRTLYNLRIESRSSLLLS
jgi:hypothetical protein